jgi:lysophospholipase L1-like esterase
VKTTVHSIYLTVLLSFLFASNGYAQSVIPHTNWILVFVDSQETVKGAYDGAKAFDGNPSTMWHTRWSGIEPDPPPPHEIRINLSAVYSIGGFRYLPRQDGISNGRIGQYEFYVSSDGVNWGSAVATGTLANDALEKEVLFTPKTGQYVRLRALTEVTGNPWTSMAELNVLGGLTSQPTITSIVPNSGPTTGGQTGVVINGTNLSGATSVTFGGTAATITNNTSTTITVTTPAHAAGAVNVVANVSAGTATSTGGYTYLAGPSITNVNPTSGLVGTSVTITGTNFGATQGTSTVTFNGTAATPTNWSATSITAPVPGGATTGPVVVKVGGVPSNGVNFTVQSGSVNLIPQTNWTLHFVDSQETVGGNYAATNSFDGNPRTFWHTRYTGIEPDPPPPHEIQINLGAVYNVSGFRYLPRQDGTSNGRIAQYEFYVSTDPANWGAAVATGTFAYTGLEKQILFSPKSGRYVRLRALSEVTGKPWTSIAELNVLQSGTGANQAPNGVINTPAGNTTIVVGSAINFTGTGSDPDGNLPLSFRWTFGPGSGIPDATVEDPGLVQFNTPGTFIVTFTVSDALGLADATPATRTITVQSGSSGVPIPQTNWTLLFVDSQEVVGGNYAATNAFDGNTNTFWHTRYFQINPDPPPPHEIQINLGAVHNIGGFRYLPRQDGISSGRIGQYEFYVSLNGVNWGSPVATGTFANNALEKEVSFIPKVGQYVRLRALTEVNGQPYTSVAELNVLQAACITPSVSLIQPQSYFLQTSANLHVLADACLTAGQGVRLMIDGGAAFGGPQLDDYTAPYEVVFTGLAQFEHVVDALVIDSAGTPVAGSATHDQAINVGIGDYFVAMGDSITEGFGDNIPSDDSSQDGRITSGGYPPILDDLLTNIKGSPHTVVNEGIGGTRSSNGVTLIPTLLQKHPDAQRFLILYGMNDAAGITPVPSGLGLQPGNSGYPGSFKDNMQRIINAIKSASKVPILAKVPVAVPLTGQRNQMIEQYNLVIDELVANPANNITIPPPDFHTYFETHYPSEYFDSIHPNGIGYQSMGDLWIQVLTQ